jgi:hypothetical protein
MTDSYECTADGKKFATSRALNLHLSRVHGEKPSEPRKNELTQAQRDKTALVLSKTSPTRLANVPLKFIATRRGDPTICFSPEEQKEVDAAMQDLIAESDVGMLDKLGPYLPWINFLFNAAPIVLEKLIKIASAPVVPVAPVAGEPPKKPTPSKDAPATLTRQDVMPDA